MNNTPLQTAQTTFSRLFSAGQNTEPNEDNRQFVPQNVNGHRKSKNKTVRQNAYVFTDYDTSNDVIYDGVDQEPNWIRNPTQTRM